MFELDKMGKLTIFAQFNEGYGDPDHGPDSLPAEGTWTWWRTGEHPQGLYLALDWKDPQFAKEFADNRATFPIMQDDALGEPSDFGWLSCHACEYSSEGYPEPGHKTKCDGLCRRAECGLHMQRRYSEKPENVLYLTDAEYSWLLDRLDDPPKELPRLRSLLDAHRKNTTTNE